MPASIDISDYQLESTVPPDIFQEQMSNLMTGLAWVRTYLDDLLVITSGSFHDHLQHVRIAEGNTRPRWSLACEYTCVLGWEGTRRVTFSQRRQVAAEKGIVEAIPALAIVASFAYLLPTNLA